VGEEAATVEEVCEPFLVRAGMVARTPRGRVATAQAFTHLGMTPPVGLAGLGIGAPPGCGEPGLFD
jgi:Holliday junction DNA helicase RuvB